MRTALATLLALVLISLPVTSTAQSRATVDVRHTGEDSIGRTLAFALREAVRTSSRYELLAGPKSTFRIALVTLDPDKDTTESGSRTVAALTFTMKNTNPFDSRKPETWYPIYLRSFVIIAGGVRVSDQARSILADLEAEIIEYQKDSASQK